MASDNRLDALPPALHLPFLRQLWLGGNRLAGVPAWPWLPSLRELQLQDNQLELLAPVQARTAFLAADSQLSWSQPRVGTDACCVVWASAWASKCPGGLPPLQNPCQPGLAWSASPLQRPRASHPSTW